MLFESDIELAVRKSKTFEACLKQEFGAQGDNFDQLIKSVEGKLAPEIAAQLDRVRRMRNEVVHNMGQDRLRNRREFEELCRNIETTFNRVTNSRLTRIRLEWIVLILLATVGLFICMLLESPA